jgi:hypothetical protein
MIGHGRGISRDIHGGWWIENNDVGYKLRDMLERKDDKGQ